LVARLRESELPAEVGYPSVNGALLAAAVTYPEWLSPWEERFEAWQWHLQADGLDKTRTSVVRLAVNGLAYVEFSGLKAPKEEERKALLETLLEMTDCSETTLREAA
jgi:hypothetical protein